MDDHTTYEEQLDPELLARVEAWREEQARAHLDDDDDTRGVDPEVAGLLSNEQDEVWRTRGRAAPGGVPGTPDEKDESSGSFSADGSLRGAHRNYEDAGDKRPAVNVPQVDKWGNVPGEQKRARRLQRRPGLRDLGDTNYNRLTRGDDVPGWSIAWREPTGFPPGRPRAVDGKVTQAEVLARVRREVGFGLDDFERLAGGSRSKRDAEERARLAAAVAEVAARAHGRGALKLLALAYDCRPKTIQRLCREAQAAGQST